MESWLSGVVREALTGGSSGVMGDGSDGLEWLR